MFRSVMWTALTLLACGGAQALDDQTALGQFEGQTDVGNVLHPGSAEYDAATKVYAVSGSGGNMWSGTDEFHFVWKKISAADLSLTADVSIQGTGGDGHRKAVLMIRQSLDPDDAYVDVARHGEGLTSLQFREKRGDTTREIESKVSGPAKLRIEKHGSRFFMWVGADGDKLEFAGGSAWVDLRSPFYVGLGVCAHDKNAVEKATFSNVVIDTDPKHFKGKGHFSTIETVLLSGDARTAYVSQKHLSVPGWSADGHAVTFEGDGEIDHTPFEPLRTAAPIGAAIAAKSGADFSYVAVKNGDHEQIWRKSADGSQADQFTPDDFNNTAPHLSHDCKYLAFLSYSKEYNKFSENTPVELRLMTLQDNSIKLLANFVGGPESLGAQPWSPDGKRIVFVSYQSAVSSK